MRLEFFEVILDQGLLGLAESSLDGIELRGDIHAGTARFNPALTFVTAR
jgi:hypothetical protein